MRKHSDRNHAQIGAQRFGLWRGWIASGWRFGAACVNIVYMSSNELLGRPVSVRLPEALRERVEALATAGRRSRGDVLREAMEREVDRLEWEYRVAERAADARAGRVQTVTLAELNAELGDLGAVDTSVLDEIE